MPEGPVIGAEPRQVTPGPDEGFLHDVICARPVRAEALDVAVQGLGTKTVQPADPGVGVAEQLAPGSIRDGRMNGRHIY